MADDDDSATPLSVKDRVAALNRSTRGPSLLRSAHCHPASSSPTSPASMHNDGPLSSSPKSCRSLDHIPSMKPFSSSRPPSPALSTSSSSRSAQNSFSSGDDEILTWLKARQRGPPPATPPRPASPAALATKAAPLFVPYLGSSSALKQAVVPIPLSSKTTPTEVVEDMISFTSPKTPQPDDDNLWGGKFTVEPPTPDPRRVVGVWPPGTAVSSPPWSPALPPRPPSIKSSSPSPPLLPPRRVSDNALAVSPVKKIPPAVPERRKVSNNAVIQPTHKRRGTQSSFHSISLNSDAGSEDDILSSVGPPVVPARPSKATSTVTVNGHQFNNLSSFSRAPLPPPRRNVTLPTLRSSSHTRRTSPPLLTPTRKNTLVTNTGRSVSQGNYRSTRNVERSDKYVEVWDRQLKVEEASGRLIKRSEGVRMCGIVIRQLWKRSGLSMTILSHIWCMCDVKQVGSLNRDEFLKGMKMIEVRLQMMKLPSSTTSRNGVNGKRYRELGKQSEMNLLITL